MATEARRPAPVEMPLELRVGLDLLVRRCGGLVGSPRGIAVGPDWVLDALVGYGWQEDPAGPFVAVGVGTAALSVVATATGTAPDRLLTLEEAPVGRLLGPLRTGSVRLTLASLSGLSELGYGPVRVAGIYGPAAIGWAVAERVLRGVGRPDLADRCRIGMLRSLLASPVGRRLALVRAVEYRRTAA